MYVIALTVELKFIRSAERTQLNKISKCILLFHIDLGRLVPPPSSPVFLTLGHGEVVTHGILIPAFVGSNPTAPAICLLVYSQRKEVESCGNHKRGEPTI